MGGRTAARLNGRAPLAVLLITIVLTAAGSDVLRDALAWDRHRILNGELWRLLTGHLVHAGTLHTIVNALAGATLLAWPATATVRIESAACAMIIIAVAISSALFVPDWPATYVGASGLLHGVFAYTLVVGRGPPRLHGLLLAGLWIKLAIEQVFGPLDGARDLLGTATAVDAHLIGAAAGTALAVFERRRRTGDGQ